MPLTIFDLVVLGVIAISALLASVRGFTREVLAIVSWVTAAAVAWLFHPQLLPIAQQYIPNKTVALVVAIAALFLVTLIVVSLVTARVSDFVLDSRIGALDRTLGFIFGSARGLLLCVVGYLLFAALVPEKMQENYIWLRDARSKPLLEQSGRSLLAILPQDVDLDIVKRLAKPKGGGDPSEPAEEPKGQNAPQPPQRSGSLAPTTGATPSATDRQNLQRAIDQTAPRPPGQVPGQAPAQPARP
jgi:membrane protein required for colicin V production